MMTNFRVVVIVANWDIMLYDDIKLKDGQSHELIKRIFFWQHIFISYIIKKSASLLICVLYLYISSYSYVLNDYGFGKICPVVNICRASSAMMMMRRSKKNNNNNNTTTNSIWLSVLWSLYIGFFRSVKTLNSHFIKHDIYDLYAFEK